MHVQELDDDLCSWTHRNLGGYIRGGVSRRDAAKVEDHLAECRRCMAIYLELTEVNANLSGLLAPVLLGGAAAAYVASATGGVALKGGLLVLLDRARDAVAAHAPASAVAGVAATAVVGGAVFVTVDPDRPAPAPADSSAVSTPQPGPEDAERRPTESGQRTGRAPAPGPPSAPTGGGATAAVLPAAAGPAALPEPDASVAPPPAEPPATPADPDPDPDPDPQPEPEPEPDPETADLRVTGFATAQGGGVFKVVVVVSGVTAGVPTTLALEGEGPSVVLTGDGRCDSLSVGAGSCRVTGPSTVFDFTAAASPAGGSALVFTVSAAGGPDDPRPGNNRARVVLAS
jgi:hypothetical protein